MTEVRVLSFHAQYRCRHAGACCSSNWPIPVEVDRLATLRTALANGTVRAAVAGCEAIVDIGASHPTEPPALLGRAHDRCVFFDGAGSPSGGRCLIHGALGHEALPLACRQFPRVSVVDPRGTSVTLSHYCPTAAGLLETHAEGQGAAAILLNVRAFAPTAEYVGLDARDALPPLLRPDMLMDWESWWECERLSVELLATADTVADGLARLRAAVHDVASWSPADGALSDRVATAFRHGRRSPASVPGAHLVAAVHDVIPSDLAPPPVMAEGPPSEHVRCRFLAAHAFANWAIHLGTGLRTWLLSIEAAAALIDAGLGIRAADLRLRHLADTRALCAALAKLG